MNESNQTGGHANESFRFVQLSDLHLSYIGSPSPLQLANKRILGYLSWLRKRRHTHQRWILDLAIEEIKRLHVDHYAITGDFTHIGLKNEFEQVHQWLTMLAPAYDVTVVPGNHDLYVNEKWDRSFSLWEKYLAGDDTSRSQTKSNITQDAYAQLNQLYPTVRTRHSVAFIGLSSVFAAPWFRATGNVAEQQLERLQKILSSKALSTYCKVLLIHHPLTTTNTPNRKCLLNRSQLIDLLKQYPVELVLHGHGHNTCFDSIQSNNNTAIPIIGMSSSSSTQQARNHKAEFLLFDITKHQSNWSINKKNYTLDLKRKTFTPTAQQEFIMPFAT